MDILSFANPEELRRYSEEILAAANRGIHPRQHALTFGSHWVKFSVDAELVPRPTRYGYVPTIIEHLLDSHPDRAAYCLVADIERRLQEDDMLLSVSSDGKVGEIHRSEVWPIEASTYEAARKAGWKTTGMDTLSRLELLAARTAYAAHIAKERE